MRNAPVPAPQRPLTSEAKTSWAAKVSSSPIPRSTAFSVPVSPEAPRRHLLRRRWVLPCLRHLLHCMPRFPFATRGGPQSLLRGAQFRSPCRLQRALRVLAVLLCLLRKPGSSASASTPAPPRPPPETAPGVSNSAPEDATRFDALVAQVESLTWLLTEQVQANKQLQEQLQAVLLESADLRRRLRAAGKRPRSTTGADTGESVIPDGGALKRTATARRTQRFVGAPQGGTPQPMSSTSSHQEGPDSCGESLAAEPVMLGTWNVSY